ncbi:7775_t:CDS:1 [Diversispora eburnea]|uniref:7775_t:CDS:1 n=1 Tax=Diversispora eburnea TaxID=1213867 RepID=A0A9N8V4H0_9GLOM|nr:7775_t:CDS:1 [Diversispora eburnea]
MPSISDKKSGTATFKENSDSTTEKKFKNITRAASKKLSKIRQRISIRDQNAESPITIQDEKNFGLFSQDYSILENMKINHDNNNISDDKNGNIHLKRNSSLDKVKKAVKRIAGIGKERKGHSEAYHQDGKTNPFE